MRISCAACATALTLALGLAPSLALTGCGLVTGESTIATIETPAYYVFESKVVDGGVVTDPNDFFLDRPTEIEPWYYLTVALLDDANGVLVSDGRQADFTYKRTGNTIRLHVSQDLGYDGAKLRLEEDGQVLRRHWGGITLRLADEPPGPFASREERTYAVS